MFLLLEHFEKNSNLSLLNRNFPTFSMVKQPSRPKATGSGAPRHALFSMPPHQQQYASQALGGLKASCSKLRNKLHFKHQQMGVEWVIG
jgi:hypothetical protein